MTTPLQLAPFHPTRRGIVRLTLEDLAASLGLPPDTAVLDVRHDPMTAAVEVLITAPDLNEVAPLCEPPHVTGRRATANRYRAAWQSARRRAQTTRIALEFLENAPLELVLEETTETVGWAPDPTTPHNTDLVLARTIRDERVVGLCPRYPDGEWVHGSGSCPDLGTAATPDETP